MSRYGGLVLKFLQLARYSQPGSLRAEGYAEDSIGTVEERQNSGGHRAQIQMQRRGQSTSSGVQVRENFSSTLASLPRQFIGLLRAEEALSIFNSGSRIPQLHIVSLSFSFFFPPPCIPNKTSLKVTTKVSQHFQFRKAAETFPINDIFAGANLEIQCSRYNLPLVQPGTKTRPSKQRQLFSPFSISLRGKCAHEYVPLPMAKRFIRAFTF